MYDMLTLSEAKVAYIKAAKATVKNTKIKTKTQIHAIYELPIIRNADNIAVIYSEFNGKECEILVDDEDYYRILCCDKLLIIDLYVYVIKYKMQFSLHRFILNYEGPKEVDHVYNNTFDNRKSQLRLATHQENLYNRNYNNTNKSSQYVGVFLNTLAVESGAQSVWRANITYNYQRIIIGDFNDEHKAGKARDIATVKYFKEFGKLNFPENIIEYNQNQEDSLYIKYMEMLLPNTKYVMETNIIMVTTPKTNVYKHTVTSDEYLQILSANKIRQEELDTRNKILQDELDAVNEIKRTKERQEYEDSCKIMYDESKKICKEMSIEELLATFDI